MDAAAPCWIRKVQTDFANDWTLYSPGKCERRVAYLTCSRTRYALAGRLSPQPTRPSGCSGSFTTPKRHLALTSLPVVLPPRQSCGWLIQPRWSPVARSVLLLAVIQCPQHNFQPAKCNDDYNGFQHKWSSYHRLGMKPRRTFPLQHDLIPPSTAACPGRHARQSACR